MSYWRVGQHFVFKPNLLTSSTSAVKFLPSSFFPTLTTLRSIFSTALIKTVPANKKQLNFLLKLKHQPKIWVRRISSSCTKMGTEGDSGYAPQNTEKNRLVWIDLEMTGLELEKDTIIEIACIVTEGDLSLVEEGPNLVIHQSDEVLNGMGEWCVQHHGQSGLTEAVRKSQISLQAAEQTVLDFVTRLTPKGMCPMAGNSIGTDKKFIEKYMPALASHLHYRVVDVSSVKELCRRWYPEIKLSKPKKANTHRAVDDIRESIEELKYYRSKIFR